MKKIIRLTERDITRIVRRVIRENETSSELTMVGRDSFNSCLSKSNNVTAKNIAKLIKTSCNDFNDSAFSNWDEVKFTNTVEKIKDQLTYTSVNDLLKCFMKVSKKNGYFNDEPTSEPILQLSEIMMDDYEPNGILTGTEDDLAKRVLKVVNQFK